MLYHVKASQIILSRLQMNRQQCFIIYKKGKFFIEVFPSNHEINPLFQA